MAENMHIPSKKRTSWAQPSLSRDFALLSVAIIFIMILISAWVAWITYVKHSERIDVELAKEADRIERTLESEIESTRHLLMALGRQIALNEEKDLTNIAHLLQAFSTGNEKYALWSWSDTSNKIVVSSNMGLLEDPVDISDRDYLRRSLSSPWVLYIGKPIEGRVSNRWVIPVAMGISDNTGKYIGTLNTSIDISELTKQISHIVKREGISFAVISRSFVPLTVVGDQEEFSISKLPLERLERIDFNKTPRGVIGRAGLFSSAGTYSFFEVSDKYPYIIVVGYDTKASDTAIRSLLWPRLIQIAVVAGFLLSFLGIIRSRVIKPVVELSEISAHVAAGDEYHPLSKIGPTEIEQLAAQIKLISEYINERKMLENELRNKIGELQNSHFRAQTEIRQRAILLAGLLSEYKKSLHNINVLAQQLKEQQFGPIENESYRKCAADIHQTGTTLELMVRKLIALSRVDATAIVTREEPVRLKVVTEQAVQFVAETFENAGVTPPSFFDREIVPSAVIQGDKLHLQQALSYAMLYLTAQKEEGEKADIHLYSSYLSAGKGDEALLFAVGIGKASGLSESTMLATMREMNDKELKMLTMSDDIMDQLHLTLAYALLRGMDIKLALVRSAEEGAWCVLSFPPSRILRKDEGI